MSEEKRNERKCSEERIYTMNEYRTKETTNAVINDERSEVVMGKEIWPDVDGAGELNNFLGQIGVKAVFLLQDGIKLEYPVNLELYQVSVDSCYLRDVKTKAPVLHYYEDFGELVFEIAGKEFKVPILEEAI